MGYIFIRIFVGNGEEQISQSLFSNAIPATYCSASLAQLEDETYHLLKLDAPAKLSLSQNLLHEFNS